MKNNLESVVSEMATYLLTNGPSAPKEIRDGISLNLWPSERAKTRFDGVYNAIRHIVAASESRHALFERLHTAKSPIRSNEYTISKHGRRLLRTNKKSFVKKAISDYRRYQSSRKDSVPEVITIKKSSTIISGEAQYVARDLARRFAGRTIGVIVTEAK